MSMAMMVAMASRKRDERGRYSEGEEMRRTEGDRHMGNDHSTHMGGYGRELTDRPEMRSRRDDRGRYMEGETTYNRIRAHNRPDYDGQDPYSGETDSWPEDDKAGEVRGGTYSYRRADGGTGRLSYFKGHKTDPMEQRKREEPQRMGFQQHQEHKPFDKETAMQWVDSMEDKDGVKGGAYTWHQAQQYGRNMGITGEERLVEFYAAMNAMHSDFWPAAKKFGVDKPEFYAVMAKCFIEDPDAVEDKVKMYYECIVKHDA